MINAIIVEDELPLGQYLKQVISEIDDLIAVTGIYQDITPAVNAIQKYNPDIIFLDVMLPEGTAFDLLNCLKNWHAEIIFVTAHESFWAEAFEYAAVGYVVKPVNPVALSGAIANARKRIRAGTVTGVAELMEKVLAKEQADKLAIPTEDGYEFVDLGSIIRLESNSSYTWIFMGNGRRTLSSYNIGEFRKILPGKEFIQVHKSHIISFRHIVRYHMRDSLAEMNDKSMVPVSRRNRTDFTDRFFTPRRL